MTADDIPRIDRRFLDRERRRLGEKRFMAEFYNEWIAEGGGFFSQSFFDALDGERAPYMDAAPDPVPGPVYDPAVIQAARARAGALNSIVRAMDKP